MSDGIMKGGAEFEFEIPYIDLVHFSQYPGVMAREAVIVGQTPPALDKPFVYCDMGCGTGATLLILGASFPDSQFFGVDLSAEHIAHAEAMRVKAGIDNVTFFCGSFAQAADGTVPPCDFISAHGILSWIPEDAETELFSAVQTLLKPGGLFQVSANLEPGWGQMGAIRTIMRHGITSATGTPEQRLLRCISLASAIVRAKTAYGETNAEARKIIDLWKDREAAYVGHEMLGGFWRHYSVGSVLRLAQSYGLECCGPLEYKSADGRAVTSVFAPGVEDYTVLEDFVSFSRNENFRSIVFVNPVDDTFERGQMTITGDDVIGFPLLAKWSEWVSTPEDELSDFVKALDDKPHYMTLIMAKAMSGEIPEHDIASVAEMVGTALSDRNGFLYRTPAIELETEITADMPLEALHPLTTLMLEKPRTYRFGGHVPSQVMGGGVQLTVTQCALLRATLQGESDRVAYARDLIAEMDAKAPAWALPSPDRALPDPADDLAEFDAEYLPYLARLGVIGPRA